jgi:hexosaminidase
VVRLLFGPNKVVLLLLMVVSGAAAEVYWSGSYDKKGNRRSLKEVQPRFGDWTWRMIGRGFQAEPPQPKFCTMHTGVCDLNDPNASS